MLRKEQIYVCIPQLVLCLVCACLCVRLFPGGVFFFSLLSDSSCIGDNGSQLDHHNTWMETMMETIGLGYVRRGPDWTSWKLDPDPEDSSETVIYRVVEQAIRRRQGTNYW